MRGDVKCEKCSDDLGYGWDAARQRSKLVGTLYAVLCTSCVNLWGDHVRVDAGAGKTAYAELVVIDAERDATRLCYDTQGKQVLPEATQALIAIAEKREAILDRLRVVAKAWVADKLPVPQTVTP